MPYKIETEIASYIINQSYHSAVEIGFGGKTIAAEILQKAGLSILCTDVHEYPQTTIPTVVDDCVEPDLTYYSGVELIYAIRPGIEMIPSLIQLAKKVNADLIIYHLGFEIYLDGGKAIETGDIILHQYVTKC